MNKDLKQTCDNVSPRVDTAAVPVMNTSLNFKNINDNDQVALQSNSDKIATFNFMR